MTPELKEACEDIYGGGATSIEHMKTDKGPKISEFFMTGVVLISLIFGVCYLVVVGIK